MNAPARPDLIAIGEPMVEFNQTRPGEPDYLFGFGGDTSNCAIAAARQGARVGYLTALGQDPFGDALVELWSREGVDASRVHRHAAAPTGVYFVTHGSAGHQFTYLRAGSAASRYAASELPRDYIADAKVLHLSGISLAISAVACDACLEAIAVARAAGVQVAFDTNLRLRLWPLARARLTIDAVAAMADIVLPSLDDSRQLLAIEAPERIVDHYLGHGARVVALKMGADGAIVATPERRQRIETHRVEAVDATGAGDTFDGAFLAEYIRTGDPFAAGRRANVAAALATTGFGAVAPMPTREAVDAALGGSDA